MQEPAGSSPPTGEPGSRTRVLGLPVDRVTEAQVVQRVDDAIRARRPFRIGVLNANKCWLAADDPELRAFLEACELVVPETAVVWGGRWLGRRGLREVWGVVLMRTLLHEAARRGWSVYLLGAHESVVDVLAAELRAELPELRLVGHHHGYLDDLSEARVRRDLRSLRPDILFVGMGSPRQERFLAGLGEGDGLTVGLGVGGSFDVLSGFKRDAPAWIRGTGTEWLFRVLQDPRALWKRYLVVNPWFVWSVLRERLTGRVPEGVSPDDRA